MSDSERRPDGGPVEPDALAGGGGDTNGNGGREVSGPGVGGDASGSGAPTPENPTPENETPLTRREMRARGISLTTEIPVIREPLELSAQVQPVVAAQRVDETRAATGHVLRASDQTGGIAVAVPASAVPVRRALRGRIPAGAPSGAPPESPSERTVTGRRPVVRAPVTAEGMRVVDETGAISAVGSAVAPAPPSPPAGAETDVEIEAPTATPEVAGVPEAAAGASPTTADAAGAAAAGAPAGAAAAPAPSRPAVAHAAPTSPASWVSTVAMPAAVLGIEDRPEPPTGGLPITLPSTEPPAGLLGDAPAALVRQAPGDHATDEPSHIRGLPGTVGRVKAPEATHGWAALLAEQEAAARRKAAGEQAGGAPSSSNGTATSAGPTSPSGVGGGETDVEAVPASGTLGVENGQADTDVEAARATEPESSRLPSGPVRTIVLVLIGVALGLLIYLVATGSLGSLFAEGPPGAGSVVSAFAALDLPGTDQGVT